MFRNYLKLAIRNLIRNRTQSIIQIMSLSVGISVFSMISLYVYDEITVDHNYPGIENVFRVEQPESTSNPDFISFALGPVFQEKHPEILSMTRIFVNAISGYLNTIPENGKSVKRVKVRHVIFADSGFQEIFPQEYIHGDPHTAFIDKNGLVLTESTAKKLFGSENPMGKIVNQVNVVTGIIKDPLNTHLVFDAIRTWPPPRWEENRAQATSEYQRFMWGVCATYIKLHENVDKRELEKKLETTWIELEESFNYETSNSRRIYLNPLKEVHFTKIEPTRGYMTRMDRSVLAGIFGLGVNLLILGIINYVNLATARAARRKKEVALKRIVGSSRTKLILYFLTESTLTVFVSFLFAATCIQLMFPWFNNLLQADINLYFLSYPLSWGIIFLSVLFIGIISGIYPAVKMSGGSVLGYLAGGSDKGKLEIASRRLLMIAQFTMAIILIISILSMHLQLRYMKKIHAGFFKDRIAWTMIGSVPKEKSSLLLTRMSNIQGVESACLSDKIPGKIRANEAVLNAPGYIFDGYNIEWIFASYEFFEVYGLNVTHGRESLESLNRLPEGMQGKDTASEGMWFINETCRKLFDLEDPVGHRVSDDGFLTGVFDDFNFQSLRYEVEPLVIIIPNTLDRTRQLSLKLNSANIQRTLRLAEKEINRLSFGDSQEEGPDPPPREFEFIDDTFKQLYIEEDRIHAASFYISILSLIIACLGLFGLSTFMAQRRTKETGIRKALGASDMQLFSLMSWDLIRWVILSVIIGCPIGWFIMNKWQMLFAYKADLGIWIYLVAAIIAFGISFLTSGWQALKTARTNPVNSLRYE
jgi:putative ABC transport system permease protein